MKYQLIFEHSEIESCDDCICFASGYGKCGVNWESIREEDGNKPSWCPLVPLNEVTEAE